MEKTNSQKLSNFWSGFAFGVSTIALTVFILGTKKGRDLLKTVLELTENLEENLIQITSELEKELAKEKTPIIEQIISQNNNEKINNSSAIVTLLDKIKTVLPNRSKSSKKFYSK